jgi:hypothetical protein
MPTEHTPATHTHHYLPTDSEQRLRAMLRLKPYYIPMVGS